MMNKALLITFFIISNFVFGQSKYNNGFNDGYKKGYCHDKGVGCIEPIPPIAPIPAIGEDLNNYQDGYNRGFRMGLQANSGSGNSSTTRERHKTSSPKYVDDFIYNPYRDPNVLNLAIKVAELKAQHEREKSQIINQFYENVKISLEKNDSKGALLYLDKISEVEPNIPFIYAQKALCYYSKNDFLDAYNNFKKAEKLNYSDISKINFVKEKSMEYLAFSMSKEDYVKVFNFSKNVWYPTEITNYYLALSHYYSKEYDEAKIIFKKLKDFLYSKEYLEAIKKQKFIVNPYIHQK